MFSFIIHVFVSLFAVTNPIGNVPLFLALTEGYQAEERTALARKAASIPIISGPGTIATVMSLSAGSRSLIHFGGMIVGIAAVLLLTFAAFHYSTIIAKRLGQTEMNVITRLMGLILAVVAVGMIGTGLKGMFPVLAG